MAGACFDVTVLAWRKYATIYSNAGIDFEQAGIAKML
jgi:hypothetical protein